MRWLLLLVSVIMLFLFFLSLVLSITAVSNPGIRSRTTADAPPADGEFPEQHGGMYFFSKDDILQGPPVVSGL